MKPQADKSPARLRRRIAFWQWARRQWPEVEGIAEYTIRKYTALLQK